MYKLFFLTVFITASTMLSAQDKKQNGEKYKTSHEVHTAVEQLRKAMIDGDKEMLEKLAHDQLTYGHSSGQIDNKKEFVEKIASGKSDFVTIELSEENVIVEGNTAIVRHTLKATTNDGGKPGEVNLKVLLVWQKQKSGWKLLARQAVKG
ncbi:MAG TPA: nuclear transport factor 2 family protein [Chitinophagaceae bacterium]